MSAAGEEAIRSILASLREAMKGEEGIGGVLTPALDPLAVETQTITHQHPALNIAIKLYNMGLSVRFLS